MALIEAIGWIGTALLVVSYLIKDRKNLHFIALISTLLKLSYTYVHAVWPLFFNWLILIVVHCIQLFKIFREKGKK